MGIDEKAIDDFDKLWEGKFTVLNRLENIRGRLAHHAIWQVDVTLANLHDELREALIQLGEIEQQLNDLKIEQLKAEIGGK